MVNVAGRTQIMDCFFMFLLQVWVTGITPSLQWRVEGRMGGGRVCTMTPDRCTSSWMSLVTRRRRNKQEVWREVVASLLLMDVYLGGRQGGQWLVCTLTALTAQQRLPE